MAQENIKVLKKLQKRLKLPKQVEALFPEYIRVFSSITKELSNKPATAELLQWVWFCEHNKLLPADLDTFLEDALEGYAYTKTPIADIEELEEMKAWEDRLFKEGLLMDALVQLSHIERNIRIAENISIKNIMRKMDKKTSAIIEVKNS